MALGISPDAVEAQKKFDRKHSLGFPLLSDPDHRVAERYGAWGEKKMYGKSYLGIVRSSFLIDEAGKIIGAWHKVSPQNTVPEARSSLRLFNEVFSCDEFCFTLISEAHLLGAVSKT